MAKKLQLAPFPDDGALVTVTTENCELDFIILEVSQGQTVKYFADIRINDETDLKIPIGTYRFNFHYSNTSGTAKFISSVKTPLGTFPANPDNGSGIAGQGERGLTAYQVKV